MIQSQRKSIIAKPLRRLSRKIARGGRPYYVPKELRSDDVFLVSYPKSGSSWTRLMIANYLTRGTSSADGLDQFLPDIHADPDAADLAASPRLIKSHMAHVPEYRRVVYIVRDGRDVAVSSYYWMMRQGRLPQATPFGVFLERFNSGEMHFGAWSTHVDSWLDNQPEDFMVLRYEDQKTDPVKGLLRVVEFAGLDVDVDRAELAVSKSTMGAWRKAEASSEGELKPPESGSGTPFARSGAVGQYDDHFSDEQMKEFMRIHGSVLRRLGFVG